MSTPRDRAIEALAGFHICRDFGDSWGHGVELDTREATEILDALAAAGIHLTDADTKRELRASGCGRVAT